MAGFLDFLFGADGPGGQPGAVGNTLNNGIANTVLGGVGKVIAPTGNAAVGGLGDWLADVTTKNPLEILKNPASALNDQGQVSLTRLLFPDFRRADVKFKKDQQKLKDAQITGQVMNNYESMVERFMGAGTGLTPEQGHAALVEQGVAPDYADQALREEQARLERQAQAEQAAQRAGVPPSIAPFIDEKNIVSTYIADRKERGANERNADADARAESAEERAQRAEIRAEESARRAEMTPIERKVERFNLAVSNGDDPVLVEALQTDLEKSLQGSGMIAHLAEDGSMTVGSASAVVPFIGNTAKDKALAQIDTADAMLASVKDLRDIAKRSPEAFGAAGQVGGFFQNLTEQSRAFTSLQDKARADIAQGGFENPETAAVILDSFNPDIPQAAALETTLAYAIARLRDPGGKISDADYDAALATVRGGVRGRGLLANAASTRSVLDLLEKEAKRTKRRAKLRAGKGENQPKSSLKQAIERKRQAAQGGPPPPAQMTDEELQMELLRLEVP